MDSLAFLDGRTDCKTGNATLNVSYDDGSVASIHQLSVEVIEVACPLLALAFEDTRSGPRHYIENVSRDAIAALLRFIHVFPRKYIPDELGSCSISMLLHVQVYRLAQTYDIPALKMQASANITQECELSCSTTFQPPDLCGAIRFIYENLSKEEELIETITNYCVTCFLSNKLGADTEFRSLAYELRQFQQDLCMVNIRRGFVDEAAMAIIQLPIKPCRDPYKEMTERRVLGDFMYELWSIAEENQSAPVNVMREDVAILSRGPRTTYGKALSGRFHLPFRPREMSQSDRLSIIETMVEGGLDEMARPIHVPKLVNPGARPTIPTEASQFGEPEGRIQTGENKPSLKTLDPSSNDKKVEDGHFEFKTDSKQDGILDSNHNGANPAWTCPKEPEVMSFSGRTVSDKVSCLDEDEEESYSRLMDIVRSETNHLRTRLLDITRQPPDSEMLSLLAEDSDVVHQSPLIRHTASRTATQGVEPLAAMFKEHLELTKRQRQVFRLHDESETDRIRHSISKLAKRSRRTISKAQERLRTTSSGSHMSMLAKLQCPTHDPASGSCDVTIAQAYSQTDISAPSTNGATSAVMNSRPTDEAWIVAPQHSPPQSHPISKVSSVQIAADEDYDMVTAPNLPPAQLKPALRSRNSTKIPHLGADYDPVVPPSWMTGGQNIVLPECGNGLAESVSTLTGSTKALHIDEHSIATSEQDGFVKVDTASDSDWDIL
ncbi:hypothetical protein MBLNU459_g0597t1 [Dothideomycetes sp. NU459]